MTPFWAAVTAFVAGAVVGAAAMLWIVCSLERMAEKVRQDLEQ